MSALRVRIDHRTLRFAHPLRMSYGSVHSRELLLLSVERDGMCGRGEAAPLEPYDGVSIREVRAALEAYEKVLEAADAWDRTGLLRACRASADLPQALAAVDMALWELEALHGGKPLAALLADSPLSEIALSAVVDAAEPRMAAARAAAASREGYRCLKVKVGIGEDEARVRAVRTAAGPQVALRLDANGAWSVDEAARMLDRLAPCQPELFEEPVSGLGALRRLRARTSLPLAIDETAADRQAVSAGIADAVCLKLSRCGGISGLLDAAAVARAAGSRVYLGSTYDGPLGIAAAAHAAAAVRPGHPCGLATLDLFDDLGDLASAAHALPVQDGRMTIPAQPGLGV